MKRKFTFLIAALMLLTMISQPTRLWGQVESGTTYNTLSVGSLPTGWSGSDGGGTSYIKLTASNYYIQTSEFGQNGFTSIKLKARKFGGPSEEQAEITVSWYNNNTETVLGTITPSNTTLTDYTISSPTNPTGNTTGYIKIQCKGAGNGKGSGVSQVTITYTAGSITTHTFTTEVSPASSGSVTAKDSGDNTVASGSEVGEEALLTVTAEANPGYKFTSWSFVGENSDVDEATDNPTTFMMGTEDATLTANFAVAYAVNISDGIEHGSVVADMETAIAGETVTITATPAEGYNFTSFTVTKASSGTVVVTKVGNVGTFTMPAEAVTVSATFIAKTTYAITTAVTPESSGTITTDANAWEGKTVNVSVSPAGGYVYSSIAITKTSDGTASGITPSGNATDGFTFTMPAYAVTITATFTSADVYALYSGTLVEGDYVIYYNGYAMKNTVSSNRLSYSTVTPANNQIVNPNGEIVWHIAPSGDYWTIYNESVNKYAASTGAASKAQLLTSGSDDMSLWTANGTSTYEFVNKKNTSNGVNANLRNNGTYGFACYAIGTGGALSLYRKAVNSTMAVASVANGTITATPAGGSAIAEDGSTTVSSGTTVTLSATGEGSYVLEAWDVYKTGDASTKVTVTNNTFTMPDYGVTVSASFRLPTTFTVQYSVNGSIDPGLTQSDIVEGNSVTLRTSGDVTLPLPSGYAFAGWTENAATGELISGSEYTPTDNTTLYLVFIKSGETLGYNKVTSLENITEGTYIIVNDNYCLPSVSTGSGTAPAKSNDYKVTNASSTSTYTSIPANTEWIFTGSNTAMTITNSEGKYLYETNNNDGVRVHTTPDTWAFELNTSAPCYAMKGANNKRYCATYTSDWRSYTTKDYTNYKDGGRLYLYKKTPVYTLVKTISGSESMTNIEKTYIITVANGGVLTLSGTNNANAAHLIIENGGQLITNNAVQATVKKNITGYGNDDNVQTGWYTIVSPLTANYTPAGVMLENTYDLYYYDEEGMSWRNYKQTGGDHYHFDMIPEQGYLYANSATTTLSFAGDVLASDATVTKTLSFAATNDNVKGFNLMGNPFTCNITNSSNVTIGGAPFSAYYIADGTVKEGKNLIPYTISDREIKPCEGFIVQATASQDLVFNPADPGKRGETANKLSYIRIEAGNSDFMDRAYVQVGQGNTLRKMSINDNVSKVYVMNDGKDYAAVTIKEAQGEMPVNFRANENGEYTLTVNVENVEMSYLHLIDNMTGADVDLLQTPSYSFTSKTTDYASRFRLVFSANSVNDDSTNSETFAFINGEEIVITNAEADATLQVVDMTGRILVNTKGANRLSTAGMTPGVYVIRMVNGEKVKTQKIVVR